MSCHKTRTPWTDVQGAATYTGHSTRTIQEWIAQRQIPHRRLPGVKRTLFRYDELDAWLNSAPLKTIETPGGTRIVRPVATPETRPAA